MEVARLHIKRKRRHAMRLLQREDKFGDRDVSSYYVVVAGVAASILA